MYGWTTQEAVGQAVHGLLQTQFPQTRAEIVDIVLHAGRWEGELRHVPRDGQSLVVASRWAVQRNEAGASMAILEINTDITARKQAEDALRRQALHDALTNLPNRALFSDRLDQALHISRRDNIPLALLLIVLNRFKAISDIYEHRVGDELLIDVSQRLRHTLRASDTVTRLGGDEFAILLPGDDGVSAMQSAARIIATLENPLVIEGLALRIGASIGIAIAPLHTGDARTLMHYADMAMYVAKSSGRGHVIYDPQYSRKALPALLLFSSKITCSPAR